MDYRTLPAEAFPELRAERVQQLEAQHYRVSLRREEVSPDTEEGVAIVRELTDLERRIGVHHAAMPPDPAPDERPDGPDDDAPALDE